MLTATIFTRAMAPTGQPLGITLDYSTPFLLSINCQKSMSSPVGNFTIAVAPAGGQRTWFDMIDCGMYVEIRKDGKLKMMGLVTFVGLEESADGPSLQYMIRGSDLGIVFTQFAQITTQIYLRGWAYNASTVNQEFKNLISQQQRTEDQPDIPSLLPYAWKAFFSVYADQIRGGVMFSNNKTLFDMFGAEGNEFFRVSSNLKYKFPLYVNFLTTGATNLYQMVMEWVAPHFTEVWMDTASGDTSFYMGSGSMEGATAGFHLYVRPSLYIPEHFNAASSKKIPLEKVRRFLATKTSAEMHSVYALTAQGTPSGSLFSAGQVALDNDAMLKYGVKMLECSLRQAYQGKDVSHSLEDPSSLYATGGALLKSMYKDNDKLLSGELSIIGTDVSIGEKIQAEVPVGNGATRKLEALVQSVTDHIQYNTPSPTPQVGLTFVRGRLL